MFVGERAANNIPGGNEQLQAAQHAQAEGKMPDWIHKRHGWFQGEDGQWRREIPDNDMKLTGALKKGAGPVSLDRAIKHDELFKADPDLRCVTADVKSIPGYAGGYDKENRRIYVEDPNDLKTLSHEAMHDIQFRHGLTPGTLLEHAGSQEAYHNNLGEREARDVEKRLRDQSAKPDLLKTAPRGAG